MDVWDALDAGSLPKALTQPLATPWEAPGRIMGLLRLRMGAPAGVPSAELQRLARFPMCLLERAVSDAAWTGAEALGGASHPLEETLRALPRCCVVLTHGGPRTGDVAQDRPVSAAAVVDPLTNRTPLPLTEEQWDALVETFCDEGKRVVAQGAWAVGVEVARGHLWHAALSPLLGDAAALPRALARLSTVVRRLRKACPRVLVSLVVEEVAVGGITATQGVVWARLLVEAGANAVVVRTGGPHTPARLVPPVPRFPHEEGPSIHATRWVRNALPADVLVMPAGAIMSTEIAGRVLEAGVAHAVVVERWL